MAVQQRSALALLPPLPGDVTLGTLKGSYGPALLEILRHSAATDVPGVKLDIAVLLDRDQVGVSEPRSSVFKPLQHALSKLYSLTCHISADNPLWMVERKVDYRIFFVKHDGQDETQSLLESQGPILSLHTLAVAQRQWSNVYALDGEDGETLLKQFSDKRKSSQSHPRTVFEIHRVKGGISLRHTSQISASLSSSTADMPKTRHSSVAVGGTFDHLHAGHKLLLTATALVLEPLARSQQELKTSVVVGITGDELLTNKKHAEVLESWEERQYSVIRFLCAILDPDASLDNVQTDRFNDPAPNGHAVHYTFLNGLIVKCVKISDPFGPTVTERSISALIVSGETRSGGKAVNNKREEKAWEPLEIFEVDVLDETPEDEPSTPEHENFQGKISSTAIRKRLLENQA